MNVCIQILTRGEYFPILSILNFFHGIFDFNNFLTENKLKKGLDVLLSLRKSQKKSRMNTKAARTSRIDEYLYNDAKIRQKSKDKQSCKLNKRSNSRLSSPASDKYAMNRLCKDLKNAWEHISKESKSHLVHNVSSMTMSTDVDERFNMISIAYLFTVLGYLSKDTSQEKYLFYDLWTLMKGEETGGVTFEVTKKILLIIHGFNKGEDVKELDDPEGFKKIGRIMNGDCTDCIISHRQAKEIYKYFHSFSLNKVQNKMTGEVIKSDRIIKDECIFKPEVSAYSTQLASKGRPHKGNYQFYEIMTDKMNQTNQWKSIQREKKEHEVMKECTFTPEIHGVRGALGSSTNHSRSERSLLHNKSSDR